MFTQWKLFNMHRLFNFVYRLFSRTFLFVSTIFFFYLKLPIIVFRRSRAVLQKRSNLSWRTSTFQPASLQSEGKLNLYLRFALLPELLKNYCTKAILVTLLKSSITLKIFIFAIRCPSFFSLHAVKII